MSTGERQLPDDPLAFIRECVGGGRVLWTYHVNMRLVSRSVSRQTIVGSSGTFEIIESYPEDKYLPSYLVLARPAGDAVHVLFATDIAGDNVRVVTAYRPSEDEWLDDLKTRRVSR